MIPVKMTFEIQHDFVYLEGEMLVVFFSSTFSLECILLCADDNVCTAKRHTCEKKDILVVLNITSENIQIFRTIFVGFRSTFLFQIFLSENQLSIFVLLELWYLSWLLVNNCI